VVLQISAFQVARMTGLTSTPALMAFLKNFAISFSTIRKNDPNIQVQSLIIQDKYLTVLCAFENKNS
jgi:hypothetical protein